ncbi:MAG: isoprenylcysteine carboxylmethyltransferase family protein [Acidobacteria bacterium]|nr:isoprenylcysteine carboxylmethyltransferase family protein [Acidobacteriota bacterium]
MRLLALPYWFACVSVGMASIVYLVLFLANWRVPVTVDQGFRTYLGESEALMANLPLLAAFGVQHSLLARRFVKAWVPAWFHRATYWLTSGAVLFWIFLRWEPLPSYVWDHRGSWAGMLMNGLALAGGGLVLWSVVATGAADFLGLRTVLCWIRQVDPPAARLTTDGPYRWIRHPMMLGTLLVLWCGEELTRGRALFAGFMTLYVVIAVFFEERDLERTFGEKYVGYKRGTTLLP